jgi:hypothetical protein
VLKISLKNNNANIHKIKSPKDRILDQSKWDPDAITIKKRIYKNLLTYWYSRIK